MKKSIYQKTFGALALTAFVGCAPAFETGHEEVASRIEQNLGCEDFRSKTFDALYSFVDQNQDHPQFETISEKLEYKMKQLSISDTQKRDDLIKELNQLIKILTDETQKSFTASDWKEQIQLLIELEMEDTSTETHKNFNEKTRESFAKVMQLSKDLNIHCAAPLEPEAPAPLPVHDKLAEIPLALLGSRYAMANAYQSCHSLRLPAMSSSTDPVKGVVKGRKVDSVGYGREYGNLTQVQKTHYYLQGASFANGCFDALKKPLVYDYGGSPAIQSNQLNFFVNSGTGGGALGIDCSAFISSGLATAGLRYSPGTNNKPIYTRMNSSKFIDPKTSGFKCFDRVTVSPIVSIQSGDIMAVKGHVVMIDDVGEDPFGIKKASSKRDCENLSYKNYDFTVIQSSPSKGSIGINRYKASDYLSENGPGKMTDGFAFYAKAACLAQFDNKTSQPTSSNVGIIRHKGTPECQGTRTALVGESCIAQCPELN